MSKARPTSRADPIYCLNSSVNTVERKENEEARKARWRETSGLNNPDHTVCGGSVIEY